MSGGKVVLVSLQKNEVFDEMILYPAYSDEPQYNTSELGLKPADLKLEVSWDSKDREHKPCRDEVKLVQNAIRELQAENGLLITAEYKMDEHVFSASLLISPAFQTVLREVVPKSIVRLKGSLEVSGGMGETEMQITKDDFTAEFKCSDEVCYEDGTNRVEVCREYQPGNQDFNEVFITIAFSIEMEWIRSPVISAKLDLNRIGNYLLENNASKDFTVVVENGNEIKCHGFMLGFSSPVFDKMVSDDMKESASKRIEIDDVSEETFQMLLSYVYGKELLFSSMNCYQFVTLLHVAHKYDVDGLEDTIKKALLQKDSDWFVPDATLELYFLVQNVPMLEELREELLIIMGKMSEKELRACDTIQTLSKKEKGALFDEISKMKRVEGEDEIEGKDDEAKEEDDETEEEEEEIEVGDKMEERGIKRKCEEEA